MCGIVGIAGQSKDPEASFNLITALTRQTQRRGPHATGHYAADAEGKVDFFKAGIKAEDYVQSERWDHLREMNPIVMIVHDRFTTRGNAEDNFNNHPHVSKTGNIAVVHNGTLRRYDELREEFELQSDCDSELILKIIAKTGNVLEGIKNVFKMFGSTGDFACEVIYRNPKTNKSRMFFFRDCGRPGRFIDATKELGQVFFISQNDIWKDAIVEAGLEDLLSHLKIKIIPPYQIWICQTINGEVQIEKVKMRRPKRVKVPSKAITFGGDPAHMDSIDRAFWTGEAFDSNKLIDKDWLNGPID